MKCEPIPRTAWRVVFCLAIAAAALSDGRANAADLQAIVDEAVKPYLAAQPKASVVVGVVSPSGRRVFGYGTVKLDDGEGAPDGKTLYEIGSITKVFTGTLLASLVREGKVALDDPVARHLPKELHPPRIDDREITLKHLATHRSSLPVQPPLIGLFALAAGTVDNPYSRYKPEDLARTLANLKPTTPLGSKFRYSNLGVGLLGHALTHTSGAESYERLVVERICKPLEMKDTRIHLSDEQLRRFATGHNAAGKPVSAWDLASLEGAGALRSTADDMLTFVAANLGEIETPLLPTMQLAHKNLAVTDNKNVHIGMCWLRRSAPQEAGGDLLFHNGGTGGYRSFLGAAPEARLGMVVLAGSSQSVDPIAGRIAKGLLAAEKRGDAKSQ